MAMATYTGYTSWKQCVVDLCILLHLLMLVMLVDGGCEYPSFVQSSMNPSQPRREWHSHIEENARESQAKYSTISNFIGHRMQTSIFGGKKAKDKPEPFIRECSLEIKEGHFLSVHKGENANYPQYLCMVFVQRSPDVFQLRVSRMSDVEDANLCNEEMELENWPYVNKANIYHSYHDCHLHGGYNVLLFDKRKNAGICDSYDGETRIESECIQGEGIFFRFRHSNCIPEGLHMHKEQQTFCMASWQDGPNTFSVIRNDRTDHMWCMRFPSVRKRGFKAYLFRDVNCETAENPTTWDFDNYISIDMIPDEPRGMSKLCVDDYEACNFWTQPCRFAGYVMQLTCAKMCGICSETRPAKCTIPPQFRGTWVANDDDHTHTISVDDKNFSIKDYANFQCVQWDPRYLPSRDIDFMEQMFVTTFDNGCRPRYTCAQLKKHSPSILRYKLSEAQIWPFENTNGITVDCGSFKYKDIDEPHRSHFHSRHSQTIISETEHIYVDCNLDETKEFDVIYLEGHTCSGELTQEGLSTKNKMKLTLRDCPGYQSEQEFACLDSSRHGYLGQHLIVTETLDTLNRIRCWLFPLHPQLTFYLLPMAECNEGANEKISAGIVRPLATFKEHPKLKLSIVVENGIETEKSARAEAVRKAPYLREDGQHWKDTDGDEQFYNDGNLGVEIIKQNPPDPNDSSTGNRIDIGISCLLTGLSVALIIDLVI